MDNRALAELDVGRAGTALKTLDPAQSDEPHATNQSERSERIKSGRVPAAEIPRQTDEARPKETAGGTDGIDERDGCRGGWASNEPGRQTPGRVPILRRYCNGLVRQC